MANSYPTIIPGLRSPSEQIKGLVYFGRMLDKIRLAAAGKLPEGWREMRGATKPGAFDARCCRFLGIDYGALEKETVKGRTDEELIEGLSFPVYRRVATMIFMPTSSSSTEMLTIDPSDLTAALEREASADASQAAGPKT